MRKGWLSLPVSLDSPKLISLHEFLPRISPTAFTLSVTAVRPPSYQCLFLALRHVFITILFMLFHYRLPFFSLLSLISNTSLTICFISISINAHYFLMNGMKSLFFYVLPSTNFCALFPHQISSPSSNTTIVNIIFYLRLPLSLPHLLYLIIHLHLSYLCYS